MRNIQILRFAYAIACLLAATAKATEPTGIVSGRISDRDGTPMPAAEVVLRVRHADGTATRSARTDAAGDFSISDVKPGGVAVFARASDGRVGLSSIIHTAERPAEGMAVTVVMPQSLRVQVLAPDGRPLSGAYAHSVGTTGPNGEVWLRTESAKAFGLEWPESDSAGLLEIDGLPTAGPMTVDVTHPDFVRVEIEDVPPNAANPPSARLSRGGRFVLRLKGKGIAVPREGTTIRLSREGEFPYLVDVPFIPDESGLARFVVPPGTWSGFVRHPDAQALPAHFEDVVVTTDERASVEITLTPRGIVHGRVLDEAEEPVVGCLVSAAVHSAENGGDHFGYGPGWHHSAHAWTDAEGWYEIEPSVGRVRLWVNDLGKWTEPTQIELSVTRDKPAKVDLFRTLAPPVMAGIVLDPDGRPVPYAVVKPTGEQRWLVSAVADAEGRFDFTVGTFDQPDRTKPVGTLSLRVFDPHRPLETELTVPINVRKPLVPLTIRLKSTPIEPPPGIERHRPRAIAVAPGQPAPELSGRDMTNADGAIRLADLRGRFVLLDFWTVWCGPCRQHKPEVEAAARLYGDRLAVIGVHDNSVPPDKIAADVEENGPSFPTVIDTADDETTRRYGVKAFPTYVLIGPDGRVLLTSQHNRAALRADLLSALRSFLYGPERWEPIEAPRP